MKFKMLDLLTAYPLFVDFSTADLKIIAPYFVASHFPAGVTIVEQGCEATCLYLVIRGELSINYKPYDGPSMTLTHVHPGGVFGWSALLNKPVYSASVVSLTECDALVVCGENIHRLVHEHPQTGRVVLDRLAQAASSRWSNARGEIKSLLKESVAQAEK